MTKYHSNPETCINFYCLVIDTKGIQWVTAMTSTLTTQWLVCRWCGAVGAWITSCIVPWRWTRCRPWLCPAFCTPPIGRARTCPLSSSANSFAPTNYPTPPCSLWTISVNTPRLNCKCRWRFGIDAGPGSRWAKRGYWDNSRKITNRWVNLLS